MKKALSSIPVKLKSSHSYPVKKKAIRKLMQYISNFLIFSKIFIMKVKKIKHCQ